MIINCNVSFFPYAAPVYQMKEYYTYGMVDDCSGHWKNLIDCLKSKTTRYGGTSQNRSNEENLHPLWTIRSEKEAREFWKKEFLLDDESDAEKCQDGPQ